MVEDLAEGLGPARLRLERESIQGGSSRFRKSSPSVQGLGRKNSSQGPRPDNTSSSSKSRGILRRLSCCPSFIISKADKQLAAMIDFFFSGGKSFPEALALRVLRGSWRLWTRVALSLASFDGGVYDIWKWRT